jgi:hypothetical protein
MKFERTSEGGEEAGEGQDLSTIIHEDARHRASVVKVKALFTSAYITASKQCAAFEPLKKVCYLEEDWERKGTRKIGYIRFGFDCWLLC